MPRVKLTIGRVFNYLVATEPHWPRICSILLNFLLISTFFIRIRGGDYNASSGQNPAGAKTSSQSSHVSVACSPSMHSADSPHSWGVEERHWEWDINSPCYGEFDLFSHFTGVLDLKQFFLWIGYRKNSSLVWNLADRKQRLAFYT